MTDTAAEPLISDNRGFANDARNSEDDAAGVEVDESALLAPGLFIWGLTVCAGVSGLLFGYEYVTPNRDSLPAVLHLCTSALSMSCDG
jgi:SP family myo-inositol transporter-like MFS transporter 13